MRTITQPPDPWGPLTGVPGRYAFTRPNGRRVPGWEDTNVTKLAGDIGISLRYLLGVLCGQRNCTLALLQSVARALGITLSELTTRMERAYYLRATATELAPDKAAQRRVRSERRALTQQAQP